MLEEKTSQSSQSDGPKYLVWLSVAIGLALIYVGWIFVSRSMANRAIEEKAAAAQRATQAKNDAAAVEKMGGDRFEILQFYAYPGQIHRGDETDLCYGVSNAKSVTLEPQTNPMWPAFSRCVKVAPTKSTTYTLTATDANGQTKAQTVRVEVR